MSSIPCTPADEDGENRASIFHIAEAASDAKGGNPMTDVKRVRTDEKSFVELRTRTYAIPTAPHECSILEEGSTGTCYDDFQLSPAQ